MTAVTLRPITAETVRAITDLQVAPHQQHLVAPNAVSLAQALFHPEAWYRAVHDGDEPVGFVMLYDEHLRPQPPAQPRVGLWRFMIDHRHQGRGIGLQALEQVVAHVRAMYPRLAVMELSYVPGPAEPAGFYRRAGFQDTDRWDDDERVMELPLQSMPSSAAGAAPLKADTCPLCGGPNGCAASASGSFEVACWCTQVTIDESVLARIPAAMKGRACVCRRCAVGSGKATATATAAATSQPSRPNVVRRD